MITYFYNILSKNKLITAQNIQLFFFDMSNLLFTQFIMHNKHFFNTKFLLYSIINFYNWVRLVIEQYWYLCVIFNKLDIDILQILFQTSNVGLIREDIWIPGLLSNNYRICQGSQYTINVEENNICLTSLPDFFLFCASKRPLIINETNMQLIPQFVAISGITTALEKYFITLFIPKIRVKKKNMLFMDIQKILTTIKRNKLFEAEPISVRILKSATIEKYLITTKLQEGKNYLLYPIFLSIFTK